MSITRSISRRTVVVAAAGALVISSQVAYAQAKKPNVTILATGGTIAGAAATGTQSGYKSGAVTIDAMLAAVPGIAELATVKGEQISNVGSQDMSFQILLTVAKRINELAKSPDVTGFVITHGTDTLEESAFFLNLTVKTDKPVVMVGSMRPSTAVSADGPLNLYNGVGVAIDPQAKGRGRAGRDERLDSRRALADQDQHHRRPDVHVAGSRAWSAWPAMVRTTGTASPSWKHTTQAEFDIAQVTEIPRVEIIFGSVDMSGDLIDAAVAGGARGIVIAGVGNGNMTKAAVTSARQRREEGCGRGAELPCGDWTRRTECGAQRRRAGLCRFG